MYSTIEGSLVANDSRIAIVVSRFNSFITERLVEGAIDTWRRHGGDDSAITVIRVPGAWEIPVAVRKVAQSGKVDSIVALGCLMRGATAHYDQIASECAKGVTQVMLETGIHVSFGVVACDTLEQAIDRAGAKSGNKGAEAMLASIEMINVLRQIA
ncbi:MAG: 6,7-dimethyl-8-ribityllumazine synthase [Armatimonadota bacterium]|jgi:6,7-dimethyl-8-ribityllumazine synthase